MKIAVFYYIDFSGAKRVVSEHVKGLVALGNQVDVYTTDSSIDIFDPGIKANNKYQYASSSRKFNIPLLARFRSDFMDTFFNLRNIHKEIARDIDNRNYDVVLVHTDINTQAPFLLKFLKTKNIYFCLEPLRNAYEYSLRFEKNVSIIKTFYENLNRWIRKRIDRSNVLSAGNILSLSLFGRERIIAAYDLYPKVSYLGVDEKIFKPIEVKKKRQVLFVAEKRSIYGYDIAQQAMQLIPKQIRPEFKIVSWTKDNSKRLSDAELVKLYNQSLVTLSLSKFDTFGLVPLESMACGVPVIAFNVAGYRETIQNNKTGYLVDFDPEEIANKIIYSLDNPEEIDEMGRNARKWIIEQWTWKIQIKNLEKILTEFVNQ